MANSDFAGFVNWYPDSRPSLKFRNFQHSKVRPYQIIIGNGHMD